MQRRDYEEADRRIGGPRMSPQKMASTTAGERVGESFSAERGPETSDGLFLLFVCKFIICYSF